jgi:hypothetical protein
MFKIRREQMDVLAQQSLDQFQAAMLRHLRARFPAQTAGRLDPELRAMVHEGIGRAAVYGITLETDVKRYLEWMVVHGPQFDRDPKTAWAGEILRSDDLNGTEKVDRIDEAELFPGEEHA